MKSCKLNFLQIHSNVSWKRQGSGDLLKYLHREFELCVASSWSGRESFAEINWGWGLNTNQQIKLPHTAWICIFWFAPIRRQSVSLALFTHRGLLFLRFVCLTSTWGSIDVFCSRTEESRWLNRFLNHICGSCRVSGSPSFLIWASGLLRHWFPLDQDHHLGPQYDGNTNTHTHTYSHKCKQLLLTWTWKIRWNLNE